MRSDPCAFFCDRFFGDLDEDLLTLAQQFADRHLFAFMAWLSPTTARSGAPGRTGRRLARIFLSYLGSWFFRHGFLFGRCQRCSFFGFDRFSRFILSVRAIAFTCTASGFGSPTAAAAASGRKLFVRVS